MYGRHVLTSPRAHPTLSWLHANLLRIHAPQSPRRRFEEAKFFCAVVEHMPPCRDRRIAEREATDDTMFKPFGHCRCIAEMLYRRLRTPTAAVVQKNLTEVHYISENGYTVLTTPGHARDCPADLRLLPQSPSEPAFVPTIIWKRDDLGLHVNTPNEHTEGRCKTHAHQVQDHSTSRRRCLRSISISRGRRLR